MRWAIALSSVPLIFLVLIENWPLVFAFLCGMGLFVLSAVTSRNADHFVRSQYIYFAGGVVILLPAFALAIPAQSMAAGGAILPALVGFYIYRGLIRWLNITLSVICFILPFVSQDWNNAQQALAFVDRELAFEWVLLAVFGLFLALLFMRMNADLRRSNTALEAARTYAAQERERYQTLFNNAPEAYFILSAKDGAIVECNQGAERMLRGGKEKLIGKLPFELSPPYQASGEASREAAKAITRQIVSTGELTFEWVHQRLDGESFWVEVEIRRGEYQGQTVYFSTWREIEKRKRLEAELIKLANEDQLTGLLNRYSLSQAFERLLSHARRNTTPITLFFIDLDKFKYVNDSYGHKTGDLLLKRVAEILESSIRREDLAARLGGDEFVLVFEGQQSVYEIDELASKLAQKFDNPITIDGHRLKVGVSIGIASYPRDGMDFDSLLRAADNALYKAKDLGRGQHQFFSTEMADMAAEHLRIEEGINRALKQDEFRLVYQRQVSLQDGTTYGVEALVRWQDPTRGLVFPDEFLSVADDSNQLEKLERWIIHQAFAQAKEWYDSGIKFGRLAVNLSARSLQRGYASSLIHDALEKSGCPGFLLEAEISENFLLENEERGIGELEKIRKMGLELSLDDFGTGFASLRYLKEMPIDKLKIDKVFIDDIVTQKSDLDILSATIAMAHKLNLIVIAEGVEQQSQLELLKQEHCDVIQGYLFSRPVPADELFDQ